MIGPIEPTGSDSAFDDQFGLAEDAEVLGDGRPGDIVESGGDLGAGSSSDHTNLRISRRRGSANALNAVSMAIILVITYVSVN